MDLGALLSQEVADEKHEEPLIFDLRMENERRELESIFTEKKIIRVRDDYIEQLRERFQIENPALVYTPGFEECFQEYLKALTQETPLWQEGRWVYFSWSGTLTHILDPDAFQRVRTARNRNLITQEEQEKFYGAIIGIAGLSVGSSAASAIVLQGGGERMRLADHDRLVLSNTNRIRVSVENLGLPKTEIVAREIYAVNPYAKPELFPDGLTSENIEHFFAGPPKLDVVVDEVDNLAVKYQIREYAKLHRVPVVMAVDNGDNAIIDIEHYDQDPQPDFFHGRMGIVNYEQLRNLTKSETGRLIAKHVGLENTAPRMLQSLPEVGKTLVSWPQLGGAALLNGIAVAYCVRKIINDQPIETDRAFLSLDETLDPMYQTHEPKEDRRRLEEKFKELLGL